MNTDILLVMNVCFVRMLKIANEVMASEIHQKSLPKAQRYIKKGLRLLYLT
jgi:hypothetical protein